VTAASVLMFSSPCFVIASAFVIDEFSLILKFTSFVAYGSSMVCQKFKGGRACTRFNGEVYGSVNCHNFHKSQLVSSIAKSLFFNFHKHECSMLCYF
jgi:hypothetical protein